MFSCSDANSGHSAYSSTLIIALTFQDTVTPRCNVDVGRHLLGPPYRRGALWDPVDLFDIVIPRPSPQVPNVPGPKCGR